MAFDTRTLPAFLGTDAEFRTWASGIAAQIAAMGLVKHTDSGQINLATVARPAINTYAGYEIYRFDDALQATKPVYIKIEYGIAAVADRPSLAFTVGTGTNGAGTLNSQVGSRRTLLPTGSKLSGNILSSYCSGSNERLSLCTHLDPSSTLALFINIERTKDSAGDPTNDGIATAFTAGGTGFWQTVPLAGSIPAGGSIQPFFPLSSGQVGASGGDVPVSPWFVPIGHVRYGSPVFYRHADIGELVIFSINHFGETQNYMPLGDGVNFPTSLEAGGTLAIPWS